MTSEGDLWSSYDFKKIPFDQIVRVGQRTLLYRDIFCVSWLLGRFCNYRCSYCWPYARSDKKDHRPLELLITTMNEIKRQARDRGFNSFHFSFSGGEPTMHPGYLKLLEHYSNDAQNTNYQSAHMTSNCSPGLKWFGKYVEATKNLHRVSITCSYHKEFANPEKLKEKLLFLQENDIQITINMVMVPERFEALWDDALFFHEDGINVTLKPQSNPSATKVVEGYSLSQLERLKIGLPQMDYTKLKVAAVQRNWIRPKPNFPTESEERTRNPRVSPVFQVELLDPQQKKWYMDQAERFNAFEFNNFKGWECSSGYRSIIIREPDGSIKRSYSCADAPLGNIETGFSLFDRPQPCISKSCVSSADSKIPKRKPGTKAPLWPGDPMEYEKSL